MAKRKSQKKKSKPKLKGRERRLSKAPHWVASRPGGKAKNLVKRYRKYFAVDWECAIAELQALNVTFDELYLSRLRETISRDYPNEKKRTPITKREFEQYHGIEPECDGTFAYIAGYTSGGLPFGVTWEEMEEIEADWKAGNLPEAPDEAELQAEEDRSIEPREAREVREAREGGEPWDSDNETEIPF